MSSGYSLANALKNYGATSFTWSSAYTLARTRMNDGVQDELALSAATPQASGQSLVIDFAVAQALVGIAILNHNLASGAVSVLIEAADNAAITTNAVVVKASTTINTAAPYQKDTVLQFPVVTKRYWRLTFTHTGTKVISIGELIALPSITVLSRQTVYGSGDSERFIQNRNESDIGTARAVHLSGPIRTKTLTFKDLKGVSQRDELLSMWRNSFGGVVPILYIDVIESTATAATTAAQQCLWGRMQDSIAWTEDDYLLFNVDAVVIQGMGREVGA